MNGERDPLLTLENVTIGYPHYSVLEGVSLSLQRGSFIGLLGPNGSGKSTLIKTLLRILPPQRGRILYHTPDSRPPRFGYVPQRETLDPIYPLTTWEVVLMGTYGDIGPFRLVGRREKEWATHCLEQVDAGALARTLFADLSGGQRQRALFARALATRPEALLLDEPITGVDSHTTRSLLSLLATLHQKQHLTVLLVSHAHFHALREVVQEVIWIQKGRCVTGPTHKLLTPEKIAELSEMELP